MNYLDYSRRDRFLRRYFGSPEDIRARTGEDLPAVKPNCRPAQGVEYFQAGDYWAVFSSRSNHVPHQISIKMPWTSTGQWGPSM